MGGNKEKISTPVFPFISIQFCIISNSFSFFSSLAFITMK